MTNKSRKIAAVVAVALIAVTATGCTAISYEEAQASQHRVVEADLDRGLFEDRSWAYVGPSGTEVPLTENCRDEGLFAPRCLGSVDGSILFHYTSRKGNIGNEFITVHGQRYEAECVVEGPFIPGNVCGIVPAN